MIRRAAKTAASTPSSMWTAQLKVTRRRTACYATSRGGDSCPAMLNQPETNHWPTRSGYGRCWSNQKPTIDQLWFSATPPFHRFWSLIGYICASLHVFFVGRCWAMLPAGLLSRFGSLLLFAQVGSPDSSWEGTWLYEQTWFKCINWEGTWLYEQTRFKCINGKIILSIFRRSWMLAVAASSSRHGPGSHLPVSLCLSVSPSLLASLSTW